MGRKPALATVKQNFDSTILSAANLYAAVLPFIARTYESIMDNPLHANQARRVVALGFLGALAAWEEFVESVFVRYLADATSPGGYQARQRAGAAVSLQHAYELVAGQSGYDPQRHYLSWSSPSDVLARADIFFYQGQPFRAAFGHWRERLQDAAKIRNRVAHASQKARREFKSVALKHLGKAKDGKLPQGYSPGDLLVEPADRGFGALGEQPNYFIAYMNMFLDLSEKLVP